MPTGDNLLSLNPSVVARSLGAAAFLLVVASIATQCVRFGLGYDYVKGIVPLFHLDNEQNIPTFFSALMLLFSALLLAAIAVLNSKSRAPYVLKWTALSFMFVYLAYDELFQIHENFEILEKLHQIRAVLAGGVLGFLDFSWVVPYAIFVIFLAIFFWKFASHLPATTRAGFMIAAAIYFGGAIGIDQIGERYAELHGDNFTHDLIATIEESLEMAGVIVFIWTLLKYCEDKYKQVQFRIGT